MSLLSYNKLALVYTSTWRSFFLKGEKNDGGCICQHDPNKKFKFNFMRSSVPPAATFASRQAAEWVPAPLRT